MSTWKAFVQFEPWSGRERLHLARFRNEAGQADVVEPFTLKTYREGESRTDSGAAIEGMSWGDKGEVRQFLRAVMTAGWELGIRPDGFEDSTRELKAVRDHLADMRKIAKLPA